MQVISFRQFAPSPLILQEKAALWPLCSSTARRPAQAPRGATESRRQNLPTPVQGHRMPLWRFPQEEPEARDGLFWGSVPPATDFRYFLFSENLLVLPYFYQAWFYYPRAIIPNDSEHKLTCMYSVAPACLAALRRQGSYSRRDITALLGL